MTQTSVYIIGNPENGPKKIGIAQNTKRRLGQLQTANSEKLKVLYSIKFNTTEEAKSIESQAHIALNKFRLSGEWFEITVEQGIQTIEGIINPQTKEIPYEEQLLRIQKIKIDLLRNKEEGQFLRNEINRTKMYLDTLTTTLQANLKEFGDLDDELKKLEN